MKNLTLCLLLWCANSAFAATTDFFCDNATVNTSNVWAGSTATALPVYQSGAGTWNGTSTFTPTDGSTPASTVSAGMWASVYTNGVVKAGYIAQVVSVAAGVNGVITLSTAAFGGTAPGSSTVNIAVGGCWHGPGTAGVVGGSGGATNYFPFDFVTTTMTNGAGSATKVYIKGGTQYAVTNTITHGKNGVIFEGYTATTGDGGFANIDGGTAVAGYILFTLSGSSDVFRNFIFSNNGNNGTSSGFNVTGSGEVFDNCIFHDFRGTVNMSGGSCYIRGCEVTNCNRSFTVTVGALKTAGGSIIKNTLVHDNLGSANCDGFLDFGSYYERCAAWNNGGAGWNIQNNSTATSFSGCDAWSNALAGIDIKSTSSINVILENCNMLKNGGMGLTNTGNAASLVILNNCAFGKGTVTNALGDLPTNASLITNNLTWYAANVTPWVDPTNGNFSSLTAGKALGYRKFLQGAVNSPTNTVAFPDIGVGQGSDTNSTASGGAYTFAQ